MDDDIHDLNQISNALKEHCDYHHIQYNVDLCIGLLKKLKLGCCI